MYVHTVHYSETFELYLRPRFPRSLALTHTRQHAWRRHARTHTHTTQVKGWCNCDITAWPATAWHILLLFMPPGSGANTSLATCDPQAVFRLFAFCRPLYALLPPHARTAIGDKMPRARNETMHSGTQAMDDDTMAGHMAAITALVDILSTQAQTQAAVAAVASPEMAASWRVAIHACSVAAEQVRATGAATWTCVPQETMDLTMWQLDAVRVEQLRLACELEALNERVNNTAAHSTQEKNAMREEKNAQMAGQLVSEVVKDDL